MRRALVALLVLGACGHDADQPLDATPADAPDGDGPLPDAAPACDHVTGGTAIALRLVAEARETGVTLVTSPPDDPRLFVLEQDGLIRVIENGTLLPEPFADLRIAAGGPVAGQPGVAGYETGLLGMAFHPRYAMTGELFIYFTGIRNQDLHDFLLRCQVSSDPNKLDMTSCVELLGYRDPASNHNGGMLEFGSDGYLYLGLGDGGGGGDPQRLAQDPSSFFGKMLRLDVDARTVDREYGIPADNPFVGGGGAPEVYMLGLRNPWRWSFDRATGDMWIGDVGQEKFEELNVLRPAEQRGANLGWSVYEGTTCCAAGDLGYRCGQLGTQQPCAPDGKIFPKDIRLQSDNWQAIIAGQVYRGSCYPDLVGWHLYSDWAERRILRARLKDDDTLEIVDTGVSVAEAPSSIHADARGELYLTTTNGRVYAIEVTPP